ncbi:hypothetical protein BDI4_940005 [Burkholderia diffusa]|nr:hypothetical protein BDI4_940005 [Burkholderia diffusa]
MRWFYPQLGEIESRIAAQTFNQDLTKSLHLGLDFLILAGSVFKLRLDVKALVFLFIGNQGPLIGAFLAFSLSSCASLSP